MAQGISKLGKAKKSAGSQKHKAVKSIKTVTKGRKHYSAKGAKATEARADQDVSGSCQGGRCRLQILPQRCCYKGKNRIRKAIERTQQKARQGKEIDGATQGTTEKD
jgi:hypothetical protein